MGSYGGALQCRVENRDFLDRPSPPGDGNRSRVPRAGLNEYEIDLSEKNGRALRKVAGRRPVLSQMKIALLGACGLASPGFA
jgi:hypothetical protein